MQEMMENKKLLKSLAMLAVIISVFFVVKIIADMRAFKYIGANIAPTRTIVVEGKGEIFAIPDIANISFGASQDGTTVAAAQKTVTDKINAALSMLKANGIEDKDIKTVDYSANPRYEIQPPCISGFCPNRESKIIGYTVNQSIAVKVRDTDKTGTLLDGLAKVGVTNISGPNFTIDDQDAVVAQARAKAIDQAKAKAEVLADQLGVNLGRITSFNENGNYPVYYAKDSFASGVANQAIAPMPSLPAGENKITSNVTITYEIR